RRAASDRPGGAHRDRSGGRSARPCRPDRRRRPPGRRVLARHAPAAGAGGRAARRPRHADPGRAGQRPGPARRALAARADPGARRAGAVGARVQPRAGGAGTGRRRRDRHREGTPGGARTDDRAGPRRREPRGRVPAPDRSSVMTATSMITAELFKLRTVRTPWIVAAVLAGLVVAGIGFNAVLLGEPGQPPLTPEVLGDLARMPGRLAGGAAVLVGLLLATSEYRHHTVLTTRLAQPRPV